MSGEEAAEAVLKNARICLVADGRGCQTVGRISEARCGLTSTNEICIALSARGSKEELYSLPGRGRPTVILTSWVTAPVMERVKPTGGCLLITEWRDDAVGRTAKPACTMWGEHSNEIEAADVLLWKSHHERTVSKLMIGIRIPGARMETIYRAKF